MDLQYFITRKPYSNGTACRGFEPARRQRVVSTDKNWRRSNQSGIIIRSTANAIADRQSAIIAITHRLLSPYRRETCEQNSKKSWIAFP